MALQIRKGDLVEVISGSDKGKQGRVLAVNPEKGRLRVEKVRIQKRHLKAGRKGRAPVASSSRRASSTRRT